jgi:hypothetical protein
MNDFDLNAKLKGVPLPERAEDYWENFPAQVRRQLRRATPPPEVCESWRPRFAWNLGAGFACLAIGLFMIGQPLKAASRIVSQKEKLISQQLAALPHYFRAFIADENGLHYLVAEKE